MVWMLQLAVGLRTLSGTRHLQTHFVLTIEKEGHQADGPACWFSHQGVRDGMTWWMSVGCLCSESVAPQLCVFE